MNRHIVYSAACTYGIYICARDRDAKLEGAARARLKRLLMRETLPHNLVRLRLFGVSGFCSRSLLRFVFKMRNVRDGRSISYRSVNFAPDARYGYVELARNPVLPIDARSISARMIDRGVISLSRATRGSIEFKERALKRERKRIWCAIARNKKIR